jgi:hypothetical protein
MVAIEVNRRYLNSGGAFLVLVGNHDMMHPARHWKPAGIGNTLHLDEA